MGILALMILWTNALLVFFAAWKDRAELTRMARALDRTAKRGTIDEADSDGVLARFEIAQVGRAADATDVRTILFHDKSHTSTCLGGSVKLADGSRVDLAPDSPVDIWVPRETVADAAKSSEVPADYAKAYESAGKGVGYNRSLIVSLKKGAEIFLWDTDEGAKGLATFDPRSLLAGQRMRVALFMFGTLLGAGIVTAVALVPPALGLVSKIGGLLGLGYFLGITPLGVSLREQIRKPSRAFVRGAWTDPSGKATPPVDVAA